MTRKEAIDILKSCQPLNCGFCIQGGDEVNEALQMAINSLEVDEAYQLEYEDWKKYREEKIEQCELVHSVKQATDEELEEIVKGDKEL